MGSQIEHLPKRREIRVCEGRASEDDAYVTDTKTDADKEDYPDEGRQLSCLVHQTFHTPQRTDLSQRAYLFQTRRTVNGKACRVIINNGSTNNLISEFGCT